MTEAQKLHVVTNGAEHTVPVWPHLLSITEKHETNTEKTSKIVSSSPKLHRAR
jgi:hypothetical protein